MKLAIMQPYIYPYLGYFQLISAVDKFVVYDDVNFITRGWINRNNLLVNGKANLFTVPLKEASQNKKINEVELTDDNKWQTKFLQTIKQNYKRAPYFEPVYELIEKGISAVEPNIASYNVVQLKAVCDYLHIKTEIVPTSRIYNNDNLKGQQRIADICVKEQAKTYINPTGGIEIYDSENFSSRDIELFFIKSLPISYPQFKNEFVPWLSIIDLMMFNSIEQIQVFLGEHKLVTKEEY